jgi:DNA-binding MarR family transcriptional regulator
MTREKESLEHDIQDCLRAIGISLLSEWDLLAFVYHHGPSLISTDHIAKLVGYDKTVVDAALDRLECEKLIERVGPSQGARLHRMLTPKDAQRGSYLQQLIALSESRDGRLQLFKLLTPAGRNSGQNKLSLEKEGNWLCLKAT